MNLFVSAGDAAERASGWKCPREGPGGMTAAGGHGARTGNFGG